ncbi:hypothetical protein [Calothrix sp. NIES-2098]|uniref:hypothetical protein n=1 Tax=Calothrix sp. NIES-2098 TaxID=1954171 RepID=UPI000B5F4949|nr:hypothetical protein NIES2098_63410 [Calothrix sp. NIES-2098]
MSKVLNEDIFNEPEQVEEISLPVTEEDLLILMQKFAGYEIPTKVFSQAVAIAAYDRASAFRYADNYVNILKNKSKRKHWLKLEPAPDFRLDQRYADLKN